MSRFKGLAARLRSIVGARSSEARMEEEFHFHVEMEARRLADRDGLTDAEARRRAVLSFGGLDTHREEMRDGRGARWFDDFVADVRYALRGMRRAPTFAIAVALTLGVGIGVNGIVFGYVDALLFRAVPAHNPEKLVALYAVDAKSKVPSPLAYEDYADFRDRSNLFDGLAGMSGTPLNLVVPWSTGTADMVWGEMVTENFFTVLGMRPTIGRLFTKSDAAPGANPLAVLSYDCWTGRFNGDSSVIGRTVRINGTAFTVTGVAPRGFKGMRSFGFWPEIWVPVGMHNVVMPGSSRIYEGRGLGWMIVVGRLRPGENISHTESGVERFAAQLAHDHPASNAGVGALLIPAKSGFDNPAFVKPSVLVLASALGMFASLVTLAIICANLANLQLARAATRGHEIAVRLSLGCSRARLTRQMLVESAVLALPGALLALALLRLGPLVESWMVPRLQFQVGFRSSTNGRVVAVTFVVALIAIVLFGLAPALRSTGIRALSVLIGARRSGAQRPQRLRGILVVSQLALSVILLVGATLFARSLLLARSSDLGFESHNRLSLSVNVGLQNYNEAQGRRFYDDVLARTRALADVADAAWAFPVPFDTYGRSVSLYADGVRSTATDGSFTVPSTLASEDFINALGLRLQGGRDFTTADSLGAPLVMVVSRELASRLWPGKDPVGQRARRGSPTGPEITVVGVVGDAKYSMIGETNQRHVYEPLRQRYRDWQTLIVHVRGDPAGAIRRVKSAVAAADPALPVFGASTMDDNVASGFSTSVTAATVAGFFGALALLISSVGLYAVVASGVTERTREIGVRIALGSTPGEVMRFVMRGGARLGIVGLALGLLGAAGVSRLMASLLYGMSPADPVTFQLVPLALAIVVLIATFIPARRAVKLDPMAALRSE